MYTVELECDLGHAFEGWFDSAADYENRVQDGKLCCPVCDSEFVMRRSTAQSKTGRALMNLARYIREESAQEKDQFGGQYFKLLLD